MATDLLVRIDATSLGYTAAMEKAQAATYKFESALGQANLAVAKLDAEMAAGPAKAAAAAGAALEKQRTATLAMTKSIGTAFGVMGAAGAIGFGLIAKSAAEFDAKMATVASLIPHTAKEMDGLRVAAMNAGHGIAVSATDAADAEIELAKAGISAKDIMGGALRGALVLAAAGQTDVATATQYAASSMTQFGLAGKDVPHIADLLAAGADKALGSVTDLGYALSQAGTTANQAGLSIEDTVGVLAEFAQAGLIGERGGTTFKQMLLQLEAPTDKAKELMQQFNLSLYDTSGNIKSMPAIAENLQAAFSNLEPAVRNAALATIFGSRAVQGANILMQAGGDVTAEWIKKVNDQGFAAQQAADKLDSLNGDLDKFKAALSNAMVDTGEATQGPLRDLVQMLTGLVDGFNGLPGPVKSSVVAILAGAAVIGTMGFAVSRLIVGMAKMQDTMSKAGISMGEFSKKAIAMRAGALGAGIVLEVLAAKTHDSSIAISHLSTVAGAAAIGFAIGGPLGAALGGAVGLLQAVTDGAYNAADAEAALKLSLDPVSATLDQQTGAMTKNTAASLSKSLADAGTLDIARRLGVSYDLVTGTIMGNTDAHAQLNQALGFTSQAQADSVLAFGKSSDAMNANARDTITLLDAVKSGAVELQGYQRHIRQASGVLDYHFQQTARGAKVEDELSTAVIGGTNAVGHHTVAVDKDTKAIEKWVTENDKAVAAALQSRHDHYALVAAIDTARKSVEHITGDLNAHTKAGQKNEAMVEALANQWNGSTKAAQDADGAYEKTRQTLIDMLVAMGKSIPEAKRLTDNLLEVPDVIREARLDTAKAIAEAKDLGIKLGDVKAPDLQAKLDTLDALRKGKELGDFINRMLHDISDETVNIDLSAQASKVANTLSRFAGSGFAFGGAVRGPGTGTSDDVPIWASAGERVVAESVVRKAGRGDNARGQRVWAGIEQMILRGQMGKLGDVPAFAAGGPVVIDPQMSATGIPQSAHAIDAMFDAITASLGVALSKKFNKLLTQMSFGSGTPLGLAGSLTPAGIVRGQQFAQSQAGKPYVWGGVGPGGYDCSGFQSAVLNAAHNASNPYRRLGSTASMPWDGSQPGVGRYTIGWSTNVGGSGIGHTSGNIGGLGVESNGTDGVVVGSGALSPLSSMFNGLMHYDRGGILRPGLTLAHNATGTDEHVFRFAGGGGVPTIPPHHNPNQPTLADLAAAIRAAFRHFWFGPGATADKTKSEVHDLVQALREALGKDSPLLAHVKRLGENLIKAAKAQDRVSDHLDALRERMDAYAKSVAATFRHDPFGLGAEGLLTQLKADRNDARAMHQALRKAKAKGLDGGLFKALAASGDLDTAQQLASMTPAQIHQYEIAWKQRQKATASLGQYAGHQMFGHEIKRTANELHHLNKRLHQLEHAIHQLGPRVEHGARRGTHDGARDGMREQGRRAVLGTR